METNIHFNILTNNWKEQLDEAGKFEKRERKFGDGRFATGVHHGVGYAYRKCIKELEEVLKGEIYK